MTRVRATSLKPMSGMDVTAFTFSAIMFSMTLLISFMMNTPVLCKCVTIDLPKLRHPQSMALAEREDALMVAIFRTGDVYFGNDKIAADQLSGKIRDRLRTAGGERKVYIRADGRTRWGRIGEVIDEVRSAGVPGVGLLADQARSRP
jgi:biopolymer transport protein TolR